MSVATARKPARLSIKPGTVKSGTVTTRPGKARKPKPTVVKRLVQTFDVDGRDLQAITEWWNGRPSGVESHEDIETPGVFLTSRLYDPYSKAHFNPDASLSTPAKATA